MSRSREEIQKNYNKITVTSGSEEVFKLLLEILLDIRDAVKGSHDRTVYDIVFEARKKETKRRIEENIKRVK